MRIQLVAIACVIACKQEPKQHTEVGFSMAAATPFGALKGVAPGASLDQVKNALPTGVVAGSGNVVSEQENGVAYVVTLADGRVEQLQILVDKRSLDELFQAWRGVGEVDADNKHHFYDRAKGVRADVSSVGSDSFEIAFMHYVPLEKVLAGNTPGSIDHIDVLGRPLADVVHDFKGHRARIHDDDAQHATIEFSRDEWSVQPVELLVTATGSNVDQLAVSNIVWSETPEITKHLRTILQTRYGGSGAGDQLAENPSVRLVNNIIMVQ